MLSTIYLYYKLSFQTYKIHNVTANRMLTSEFYVG
jgi:hypothetical protein